MNLRFRPIAVDDVGLVALAACGSSNAGNAAGNPAPSESQTPTASVPQIDGLVVYASDYSVDDTVARVSDGLEEVGMVAATVDYAEAAASIGEEIAPTTVVIGGAPKAGTPIMLEQQRAGIDLPQKYLAWQDEAGQVYLGYNSVDYVAARAGIPADAPALDAARRGSGAIAAGASGTGEPVSDGATTATEDGYLVQEVSDTTVDQSIARYQKAFEAAGVMAAATVDHAAGAESIGEDLRPTTVTFVANPEVATALVGAAPTFEIDLPVRYLAWEDADGTVNVAHPDIRVLAERHDAQGVDEVVEMVSGITADFTKTASGKKN